MAIVQPIESAPGARRRLRLCSPSTLEPIGEIEVQTAADVRDALERARKAQPEWAALPVEERARYLERALKCVIERQDEIIETVIEVGTRRSRAWRFFDRPPTGCSCRGDGSASQVPGEPPMCVCPALGPRPGHRAFNG